MRLVGRAAATPPSCAGVPRLDPQNPVAAAARRRSAGRFDIRPGRFFLTPRPLVLSEHADGDAADLPPSALLVLMPPDERDVTPLRTRGLLRLTGTLHDGLELVG